MIQIHVYLLRYVRVISDFKPLATFYMYYVMLMSVGVNFDALTTGKLYGMQRRTVVYLCWMQDSNPSVVSGTKSPADCMAPDKLTQLSRIKLIITVLYYVDVLGQLDLCQQYDGVLYHGEMFCI